MARSPSAKRPPATFRCYRGEVQRSAADRAYQTYRRLYPPEDRGETLATCRAFAGLWRDEIAILAAGDDPFAGPSLDQPRTVRVDRGGYHPLNHRR